jgi:hypothetical protein
MGRSRLQQCTMPTTRSFHGEVTRQGVTYAVAVPSDVSIAFGAKGHIPVVGTIDGHPLRATMVPAGGGRHRILLNAEVRTALQVRAGDTVSLTLQRDTTSREVPVPDDLAAALDAVAGASRAFAALPPSHRKEILVWINDAVRPDTRARRIARAMAHIMED